MGLLDKVKTQAEQVATKARGEMQELQTKRELNQAYTELGRKTLELADRGEINHDELSSLVERVRSLKAQAEAEDGSDAVTASEPEQSSSNQPPAMPS
jgi:hypothetical protein